MKFKNLNLKKLKAQTILLLELLKKLTYTLGMVIAETQLKEEVNMEENGFL